MTPRDIHGLTLTGATASAMENYEAAVAELQCYRGDPVARVDAALAEAPGFAMAHVLRGWLHLLGTEFGEDCRSPVPHTPTPCDMPAATMSAAMPPQLGISSMAAGMMPRVCLRT